MINRRNYKNICVLLALTSISCSDSEGWMSGIPLSNEKISFTASLQEGWSGGQGSGDKSRAVKPDFPGLAREQKVLTTDEALSKPLYLHPIETVNKTQKNQGPTTRGTMNMSTVVDNFGVSANYIQNGSSAESEEKSLFHNEKATKEGSNWFVAGNKTWPLDGSVSFYAYAPYNVTSLSLQGSNDVVKNKTIRYTANTDFSKQPDLIVAKSENNAFTSSTANKAVGLSFSHALTAITFSISADMIPGKVKSITVSGVYGQGDYDFSNASWPSTSLANPSTYVITLNDASVKAGESKALTDKNSALMMIPQDLGPNAKVSMVFNDGAKDKTVSFSLDGTSWKAGNHITYVLSSSKITTLKMGRLDYPDGWKSVSQIRKAYDPNDPNSSVYAGLFVVNEENKVIAANVKLTLSSTSSGNSWSLPADSKQKFSPKYNYFLYYPYQASLAGLPAVDKTKICDVSSSTKFFADAIANWKIDTDQSTLDKMNDCDLQIGKASLDEDGCSVSFKMEHAMGLAEIVLDKRSFTNSICYLVGYEEYSTWNGTTTSYASCSIKNHTMYGIADHRYVSIVKPGENSFMSATDKDAWIEEVKLSPAANEVKSGTAYNSINPTTPHAYTLAVGDIYYSDGAISHQEDKLISTSERIPIGIVGYTTMNGDGNYWTEKGVSGKGGHALVMCLKTIGSNGTTDMGQNYRWYSKNEDCQRTKVDTGDEIRGSFDKDYGSGYKETKALVAKGSAFEAANAAKNYTSLPAPKDKCTGWFLPSAGQYYAVMSQLGGGISPDTWEINEFFGNMTTVSGNINAALSKVGPNQFTEFFQGTNTWAWTSSEFSPTGAVFVDSGVDDDEGSGSVRFYSGTNGKTYQRPVRPFLAF